MTQQLQTSLPPRSRSVSKGESLPSKRTFTPSRSRDLSWQIATNLLISFKYAWSGFQYAFQTQRNFRIHTLVGTAALSLALFLGLPPVEIAVLALTIGAVMGTELINTAIESVVDLTVEKTYHDLARIAKDCAAGAVLISALVSILVAIVLLVPPLIVRLGFL
jgi:diacylglycerol kinase (ATP)